MERILLSLTLAGLLVGLVALAVLLVRQRHVTDRLRRRNQELAQELRHHEAEVRHLAATRLPQLRERLAGRPVAVAGPLDPQRTNRSALGPALAAVLETFTDAVEQTREQADRSAKGALKAMMRTVQSLANEQQLAISEMQDRHDDPEVLADLLRIDHMNAQLGRRAQATAVLFGSWPGQQRSAAPLVDVVRGATSRIRDYLRVRITSEVNVAVTGRAVEPVVLALAELLDNAARHSQPNTPVEVNFQMAHNGVAVMIDDAGVAMNAEEIARATDLLSGRHQADIGALGDPPQIGFAAVGVLAARYGFTVSVDTRSPYGGVRAVVFLPNTLLTSITEESEAPVGEQPGTVTQAAAPAPVAGATASGLPKRRRATTAVAAADDDTAVAARPPRPARERAAGLGAWQRGTRSGRAAASSDTEGNPRS
ncbi:ATP-binding protein [Thermomonospora amylolytica]|uniref:ATP-binding protein n=1 Tax=Thermomonospora amylolytica TaxID=1411117 RepID=UPI000E6CA512|nr:ATP-binding protein [Thermomonospora amylolytica]